MKTKGTVFKAGTGHRFTVCVNGGRAWIKGDCVKGLAHQYFVCRQPEVLTLKSSVRLIKHRGEPTPDLETGKEVKRTHHQNTREIISTVKGWIAELEQRHRSEERRAAAFLK